MFFISGVLNWNRPYFSKHKNPLYPLGQLTWDLVLLKFREFKKKWIKNPVEKNIISETKKTWKLFFYLVLRQTSADPSRCNSTNCQNQPIQQNCRFFWTSNAIWMPFEIKNLLKQCNIVNFMTESPIFNHKGRAVL